MNIEGMRHFIDLARVGSFYGAAKGLFISQQGLNRAVSSMEKELDVKLVERSRRGVKLTREGERFLECAQACVSAYDTMLEELYGTAPEGPDANPLQLHVTYYAAQIAARAPGYVDLISTCSYQEESFDKVLARASSSDGTDLNFVDLHANTAARVLTDANIAFDPCITTKVGVVWTDGFPLAGEKELFRSDLSNLPVAYNSFREMAQLCDWLFRDHPFTDVRMLATSPRMLLDFVHAAEGGIALFDSFGFYLSQRDPSMPTDGLHFTPLATPEALCYTGFVYPKHVRLSPRAQRAVTLLSQYLDERFADYFTAFPLARP